jgi:hypothetical protein
MKDDSVGIGPSAKRMKTEGNGNTLLPRPDELMVEVEHFSNILITSLDLDA